MSLIDLADAVADCADTTLTVTRFTEVAPINGVAQPDLESTFQASMSVQPLDSEELLRLPEGDRTEGGVSVFIDTPKLQKKDQFTVVGVTYEVTVEEEWASAGNYRKYICRKVVL